MANTAASEAAPGRGGAPGSARHGIKAPGGSGSRAEGRRQASGHGDGTVSSDDEVDVRAPAATRQRVSHFSHDDDVDVRSQDHLRARGGDRTRTDRDEGDEDVDEGDGQQAAADGRFRGGAVLGQYVVMDFAGPPAQAEVKRALERVRRVRDEGAARARK